MPTPGLADRSLDHYARLVQRFLKVPVSTVALIDEGRHLLPGVAGLGSPYCDVREAPMAYSICKHVVAEQGPVVITDTRQDPRLTDNPVVAELGIAAYAGMPIVDAADRVLGSLCAVDVQPRVWTDGDLEALEDLARACSVELQQARALAEQGESLARTIFASAPVALAFFDEEQRPVLVNPQAERILACLTEDDPELADSGGTSDPSGPAGRSQGGRLVARALRGDLVDHEMEWVGPQGRQIAVVVSSRRLCREDDRTWGTLLVAQDVTELARALITNDAFIATVSHELRTPLTTIQGYLEVLDDQLDDSPPLVHEILERMGRASSNLRSRIEELLEEAARRNRLDLHPTDIALLAQRIPATFGEQARAARLDLTVSVEGTHWAVVDASRIEQALENLVSNALKFTPPGGRVDVAVCGRDTVVDVVVADTGVGMGADEVDHAFDRFWRADSARQTMVQGFGLGLNLVRDVATEHRGSVHITSSPVQGTRVVISVPRSPLWVTPGASPTGARQPAG